jgi:hypothetical protein
MVVGFAKNPVVVVAVEFGFEKIEGVEVGFAKKLLVG